MMHFIKNFSQNKKGVIAIMFGMLFPVIIATMGIGYDLAQGYMARARLSQALDAAALAVAGSQGTDEVLQARFEAFIQANYPGISTSGLTFMRNGNSIYVTGSLNVDTAFMRVFGKNQIEIFARSSVFRELQGVEVALVLDNTGSMAGSKLQNLKDASNSLINILADTAQYSQEDDPVKIALVPYTMTVNVGSEYQNAAWIDKDGLSDIADDIFLGYDINRFDMFANLGRSWGGCVEMRASPYDTAESPPITSDVNSLYVPYFAPDEPNYSGYRNNYISDETSDSRWWYRQGYFPKYDDSPQQYGTNSIGYTFGPNAGCEIAPMMRLTADFDALKTRVGDMTANGETIILSGLMWGWHALSPNAPFEDGVAYDTPRTKKIIILMTDGQNSWANSGNNNQSYYTGMGYIWQGRTGITLGNSTARQNTLNAKQAEACENAKAAGIRIYTVRVETTGDDTVMRNCASDPDDFHDVDDADELESVFISIANSIQNLRITE